MCKANNGDIMKYVFILCFLLSCNKESPKDLSTLDSILEVEKKAPLIWPIRGQLGVFAYGFTAEHQGIDITAPIGSPVLAAADGVVIKARWDDYGLGNIIEIKHTHGSLSVYAHNSKLKVRKGQTVKQGQIIAEVGNTGNSRAPHIHFEFYVSANDDYPIDPIKKGFLPPLMQGRIPQAPVEFVSCKVTQKDGSTIREKNWYIDNFNKQQRDKVKEICFKECTYYQTGTIRVRLHQKHGYITGCNFK